MAVSKLRSSFGASIRKILANSASNIESPSSRASASERSNSRSCAECSAKSPVVVILILLIGQNRLHYDRNSTRGNPNHLMTAEAIETQSFSVEIQVRYLLHVPDDVGANAILVLALHGYGSNPADMLRLTVGAVGTGHIVAALE